MNLLRYFTYLLILLSTTTMAAQPDLEYVYEDAVITIDKNIESNRNHHYFDSYTSKDQDFKKWLYIINKKADNKHGVPGPAKVITDQEGNNSFIFKINIAGVISYDTLRNTIHYKTGKKSKHKDSEKSWDVFGIRKAFAKMKAKHSFDNKLEGDLPKGSMSYLEPKRKKLKGGVDLPKDGMVLTVQIINKKGTVLQTLINGSKDKGWHHYEWKRGQYRKGKYKLKISIDDKVMTQEFKI